MPDIVVEQKEYAIPPEDASKDIFENLDEEGIKKVLEEKKAVYDHQLSTAISVIKGIVTYRNKKIDG